VTPPLTSNSAPSESRPVGYRISGPVAAVAICTTTALLAAFTLGTKSIWEDQAFSEAVARLSLPTMTKVLTHGESFNRFYYMLLHFWQLAADSEIWLRLP
jgi:hypothetical protein